MSLFRYKAIVDNNGEDLKNFGILAAENYAEAAGAIENHYGRDLIRIELLQQITNTEVLDLTVSINEHYMDEVMDKHIDDYIW